MVQRVVKFGVGIENLSRFIGRKKIGRMMKSKTFLYRINTENN